jgi:competence protein ComEC
VKGRVFIFWGIFVAAAIFRVAASLSSRPPDAYDCLKHVDRGVGTVTEDPERKETGQVFIISAEKVFVVPTASSSRAILCAADILVRVKTKPYPRFSYGDRVIFTGKLSKPFNFSGDSGRTFDYKGYLAKDGVYYEMKSAVVSLSTSTIEDFKQRSILGSLGSLADGTNSSLFSLKRGFVANLERVLGEPHAALAAGLVVGEKSALGASLLNDFRTVGLIHIVVLSGFNTTIVAVALRRTLSFLPRVWGIVVGGIGIALFGILVGGGATVVRSCFMAGIALIADLIRRDYSVHRALAFAALIMLIANPLILMHDPSFQLSFLATVGLVLLASPIEEHLRFIPEKFGMRGTVASCLATQIFVSPYILYMMGQISIIGVAVNILILPFIPATMLLVFLTGVAGFVSYAVSVVVGWGAHTLLSYELFTVEHSARLPFAAAHFPPFSIWWVAAFYAAFVGAFFWRGRIKRGRIDMAISRD